MIKSVGVVTQTCLRLDEVSKQANNNWLTKQLLLQILQNIIDFDSKGQWYAFSMFGSILEDTLHVFLRSFVPQEAEYNWNNK